MCISAERERWAVITVKEDVDTGVVRLALNQVSREDAWSEGDEVIDPVTFRAVLASELKAWELTLDSILYCGFAWLKD